LFYRKATEQNVKSINKRNSRFPLLKHIFHHSCALTDCVFGNNPTASEKSRIKKCWEFNGHDYYEFKDEIEKQVTSELAKLKNDLAVNFDDHVLHDGLLSPTYQLVLKSKFSREDSLVLTSCMLPDEKTEIDFCVILTKDRQFNKTYSRLDSDAKGVLNRVCHSIPIMNNIEAIRTPGQNYVNLCNSVRKSISEIWPPIILDLIKAKNIYAFAGVTYKFGKKGDSAKCVYFNIQREDGTLQKSEGLCFITPDLSKTIIKSVDEKDFYMSDGVVVSSLPSIHKYGDKVSFMPKIGEENDLELIRAKGCYVFFHNE